MQIIGVKFSNSTRVYSYYCTVEGVNVGDELLSPDGKVVTVVDTAIDPATIPAHIMQILKTITNRAELVLQPDGEGSLVEAYVAKPDGESSVVTAQTDLITVTQLPVIEDQLRSVKAEWDAKLAEALVLPCTPDTVKTVEAIRSVMRKDFAALDTRRKEIEEIASAPIKQFKATFKECIGDSFTQTDQALKEKIDLVKDGLRDDKRAGIESHFNKRLASFGLDFPSFAQSGINVILSATDESLIKQVDQFAERVAGEVEMIKGLPFADEVLVEYKACLIAHNAIKIVNERHKAAEEMRVKMDITPVSAPSIPTTPQAVRRVIVPTPADNEKTVCYHVTANDRKHDALDKFLKDGWYDYAKTSE